MRELTVSLLNINQAQLTIDVLNKLAWLPAETWSVQLILLDNGSDREQIQQLSDWFFANKERFSEVMWINASHNLGANGGRNIALKLAWGDSILILDNDVVLPDDPDWLDTLWQRMDNDVKIGIIGPMLVFNDYPNIVQGAGIGLTDRGRVGYLNRAKPVDQILPQLLTVVASPAACWLVRREAQQAVGLFADEFYPMQYWDVDFCVRLGQAGWKIVCDCSVRIKHIENVTTRNLKEHPYARVSARHGMRFREKWSHILPQIATITEEDIYWGPIPRDMA
ncbi:MAG: glycosyltransferase [Anaerolineae bacterium]|nr:glycosyltransferase [Anaerolineae bacterium]